MVRLLPAILPWRGDDLQRPHVADQLPGKRPGFLQGDPFSVVPATCALLEQQADQLLPWTGDGDLLLAPFPEPGVESGDLVRILDGLDDALSVLLYCRGMPLWPNLRLGQEKLLLLPARRLSLLLRGSVWTAMRPGPSRSLQNRFFLIHALDHQRSLALLAGEERLPPIVARVRRDSDLEFGLDLEATSDPRMRNLAALPRPPRVHLPWWGAGSHAAWLCNRRLCRRWPASWSEVEIQFSLGPYVLRLPARRYWFVFAASGARRRVYLR